MRISRIVASGFALLFVCAVSLGQGVAPRGQQPARPSGQGATSASPRGAQATAAKYPIVSADAEDKFERAARLESDSIIEKTLKGQIKLQTMNATLNTFTLVQSDPKLRVQNKTTNREVWLSVTAKTKLVNAPADFVTEVTSDLQISNLHVQPGRSVIIEYGFDEPNNKNVAVSITFQ